VLCPADIAVGRQQHMPAEFYLRRRPQAAVGADVAVIPDLNGAVARSQYRTAPEQHLLAEGDAALLVPLRRERAVLLDDAALADADFVGMAQGDVAAPDRPLALPAQDRRQKELAQAVADHPRQGHAEEGDQFIFAEAPQPERADDDVGVFVQGRFPAPHDVLKAAVVLDLAGHIPGADLALRILPHFYLLIDANAQR